tara:strand:+ start:1162 stop:2106 length:945 start_codon:yes stop_codon:yes gene_type:complete
MKKVLIFGASGQIGRYLIRKLTKNNYTVTAVTRNSHQKAYLLKTQANAGYLNIIQTSIFDESRLRELISDTDICINLVGILYEKSKKSNFENIHVNFPYLISKIANEYNIKQFIHISALGIDEAHDSDYANSKLKGENNIRKNFSKSIILRPSIVYSVDDNFTTNFMSLLSLLPFFPLYYNGSTKFSPIHCSDLTEIIYNLIIQNVNSLTIECIGPEILSLKEIIQKLLKLIGKKRILVPLPLFIAKLSTFFFQLLPKPPITLDQIKLLKYDNVSSGKYKTNLDMGFKNLKKFDDEVKKYCYMWRKEGEFSVKE